MATLDKVKMTFPNGDEFVARGNIDVTEMHKPRYLVDGFQNLRTLGEKAGFLDNDTAQAYIGTGSRMRSWMVEFTQWEGSADSWGSANANDDVWIKMQTLGQTIATAGIDGTNPVTLEFGEYATGGQFSPQTVVPGEINLPVNFGQEGSPSSFRPSVEWRDAADISETLHDLAP